MKITNHRLNVQQMDSPNQSGTISKPTLLVLHYTASGSSATADAKYFQNPAAKASAHLVVDRDGSTVQCVPFNKKAWHAGKSTWKGVPNCNDYSIGIEIDNWGLLTQRADGEFYSHTGNRVPKEKVMTAKNKRGNPGHWEVYPGEQMYAVEKIVDAILETYPNIKEVVGHEDIAPGRKIDPGPALYDFIRKLNNKFSDDRRNENQTKNIRKVIASSLRVRAEPSTTSDVIASLAKGMEVEVVYDGGDWAQIVKPDGWVFDKYLK